MKKFKAFLARNKESIKTTIAIAVGTGIGITAATVVVKQINREKPEVLIVLEESNEESSEESTK